MILKKSIYKRKSRILIFLKRLALFINTKKKA